MNGSPKIVPISTNSLFVEFEQTISPEINQQVHQFHKAIQNELSHYLLDSVAAYASIHLTLKPTTSIEEVTAKLVHLFNDKQALNNQKKDSNKLIEVPVYYGEEVAPDLEIIAKKANLSAPKVIELHSSPNYLIYAVGFLPGFPYMGTVDQQIATDRKEQPRQLVPAGSVGIAGEQTGIYPVKSPGGWQIIGKTPLSMITDDPTQPNLLNAGDQIKFKEISRDEFLDLGGSLSWD